MRSYLFSLLLLSLLCLVTAKYHESSTTLVALNRDPWTYLTKFSPGTEGNGGSYVIRTRLNRAYSSPHPSNITPEVTLSLYTDDKWDQVMQTTDCMERRKLADYNAPISTPTNGQWSYKTQGRFNKNGRNSVWFFVLNDCLHRMPNVGSNLRLQWQIEIFDTNGSHLENSHSSMIVLLAVSLVSIAAFFFFNSVKLFKFYQSEMTMDYPTLMLMMSLSLDFMSIAFELIHLQIYAYDGQGSFLFSFANRACSIFSQFIVLALLLLIAKGWSIDTLQIDEQDPLIYIYAFTGFVQILLVGVGVVFDEGLPKHHAYEDWTGLAVFVIRALLFIMWAVLFVKTFKNASGDKQTFFRYFGALSTVYFLAFPCLIAVSSWFLAPYMRHKVVAGGTLITQIAISIVLTMLFNGKNTQYYKVSFKGRSILPSTKLD